MSGTGFVDPRLIAQYYLMYAGVDDDMNEEMTRQALDNEHMSKQTRYTVQRYVDLRLIPRSLRFVTIFFLPAIIHWWMV